MFFLRILSFIAGSIVLFAAPFLLVSQPQLPAPPAIVLLAVLTVLLFAAAYYFFALFGHRTARSQRARYLAGGMIAFQLLAGAWLLSASRPGRRWRSRPCCASRCFCSWPSCGRATSRAATARCGAVNV